MSIVNWPESERPRDKLLKYGPASLSDAELLAIFLRTGCHGQSAVAIARELLSQFQSLRTLVESDLTEFSKLKGLGTAKYVHIKAAIELGERYLHSSIEKQDILKNPVETRKYLSMRLGAYPHEVFACLFLDNQNQIIAFKELFRGTINSATVHMREVVKESLERNAVSVIFAHNHPSGCMEPSMADLSLTRRLKEALELVDIHVLDHFVIGHGEAISFSERGLL